MVIREDWHLTGWDLKRMPISLHKISNVTRIIDMGATLAHVWTNGNSHWNFWGLAQSASGATTFIWESDNVRRKLGVLFWTPPQARKCTLERQSSLKKQKVQQQFAVGKVMLIAFFDSRGLVYQHYVTPKTTVYKEYYWDMLEKLG